MFSVDEHLFVFITTEYHQIHLRVGLPGISLFLDNRGKQKKKNKNKNPKQKQNKKDIVWEVFTEIFSTKMANLLSRHQILVESSTYFVNSVERAL